MIEKQKACMSGYLCFMVILSRAGNDAANQKVVNSTIKFLDDLTTDPVPIGIIIIRDTDLLNIQMYAETQHQFKLK